MNQQDRQDAQDARAALDELDAGDVATPLEQFLAERGLSPQTDTAPESESETEQQ